MSGSTQHATILINLGTKLSQLSPRMHRRPLPNHPCDATGRQFHSDREAAEFKKRQQIRENSVRIRELEAKLRQAYINQELALQKKQRQTIEFQKKQEKLVEAELIERQRQEVIQEEEEAERKDLINKIKYKKKLDEQIDEKQQAINTAYEQFLKEKNMIDEIIAEVKAEERKKVIESMVKRQVAQEEIQHFIESQKVFVEFENERVKRENEKILSYLAQRDAWVSEQERITKERKVLKSEEVHKLGEKLEAERVSERQKEELLYELNEGRQRELAKVKERQELEAEIRKRLNFKHCNEIAQAYKAQIKAKEQAEDEKWKRHIMHEAEKEAKLEQMGAQKRRMKMLELKREADRLLAERQKQRELEKMQEKLYWAEHREQDRQREALIEEERQKLLEEHAEKLIGFLPTGVLSEEDLERLGRKDIKLLYKTRHLHDPFEEYEQQFKPGTNY